jgi:predicted small lipoprotein YifL
MNKALLYLCLAALLAACGNKGDLYRESATTAHQRAGDAGHNPGQAQAAIRSPGMLTGAGQERLPDRDRLPNTVPGDVLAQLSQ